MMRRSSDVAPDRDELIAMRERGLTREEIAETYGVSISVVRRWIRTLRIPRPPSRNDKTAKSAENGGALVARPDDGSTIMERATAILGKRLTERRGQGYFLDGRPVRTDAIISAAGLKYHNQF